MDFMKVARSFRESLDAQKSEGTLPLHMQRFPVCCCGVVSALLGHYLNASGVQAEYVCGSGHAWLEFEDVVIDITSDQFAGRPAVFVGAKDDWYRSLGESSRRIAIRLKSNHYGEESDVLREILRKAQLPNPDI